MVDVYLTSASNLVKGGFDEAALSLLRLALYEAIRENDKRVMDITCLMLKLRNIINGEGND